MKYILLTLAMALVVAVSSCEQGKVELPVGDTGTDTVDTDETVRIDTTVKDTTDIEDTTSGDTTVEVTTVTESTESSDIPETTEETTANTDDIIAVYDSISLLFEPCELPHEALDESDIDTTYNYSNNQYLYTIMDFNATVFGRYANVKTVGFKLKSTDRVYTYSTCTDKENEKIFCQGFNILFSDIDRDGSLEILKDGQITIERDGEYLTADLNASFENYVSSKYPQNPDHVTRVSMIWNTDVSSDMPADYAGFNRYTRYFDLYYKISYDGENKYETHNLQGVFNNDSIYFCYDRSESYDINVRYLSNSTDWSVTEAYKDIEYFEDDSRRYQLYSISICGPERKKFTFYEYDELTTTSNFEESDKYPKELDNRLPVAAHGDARFDRKLIVHPNYQYAMLVFPYDIETSADIQGTAALLINLETGENQLVSSNMLLSQLYDTYEEWLEVSDKQDLWICNTRHITTDVSITDDGFVVTAYLREYNGNAVKCAVQRIDLENPDLGDRN